MTHFNGAETAATFGDPRAELSALRQGAGVADINWRGSLILTGDDRVRWLNGMVTNNIRDLAPNHGNYSFVLNPQGRIQGDLVAYNRGEYLFVTTDRSQLPKIGEIFEKYIIMDDVEITDASDKLAALAVTGPTSHEVLIRAGFQLPVLAPGELADMVWRDVGLSIVRGIYEGIQTYELWVHPDNTATLWDALLQAGATPVGVEALEAHRFLHGVPKYGVDLTERYLPQETAQSHALHFSKGCYIGQEIVERIRSRATIHRVFAGFTIDGPPLEPGTRLQHDGKDVAEITSSISLPLGGSPTLAFGYVRVEFAAPGTTLQAGDTHAVVASLPFQF